MLDTVPLQHVRGLGGKLGESIAAWSKAETASDLKVMLARRVVPGLIFCVFLCRSFGGTHASGCCQNALSVMLLKAGFCRKVGSRRDAFIAVLF